MRVQYVLYHISSEILFNEISPYLSDGYILAGIIKFVFLSSKRTKFSSIITLFLKDIVKEFLLSFKLICLGNKEFVSFHNNFLCFLLSLSLVFDNLSKPSLLNSKRAKFCSELCSLLHLPLKSFIVILVKWISRYCFIMIYDSF